MKDVGELQSAEHQAEKAQNCVVAAGNSEYTVSCQARRGPERRWQRVWQ